MPELILALDAGTTTARAALVSPDGIIRGIQRARLISSSPAPGLMEQDAAALWRTVRRLIGRVLAVAGLAARDLAAIGVTSQRTSIVVWDRRTGAPLAPMVLWNDLRGVDRSASLRGAGYLIAPQQAAAKLEAVLAGIDGASDLARQGRLAFGGVDSFLIWRLSAGGAHVTDRSQAWPTGYLDLGVMAWNGRLLADQGLHETMFPTLVDTFGRMANSARAVLGAEVPITADIADQQSALVAHGGFAGAGVAKVSYGTAAAADVSTGSKLVFKGPALPPFILTSNGVATSFCLEGMVNSAGAALDWALGALRFGSQAGFEAAAASVPDCGGVAFLPALAGLGAPEPDPTRTGLITGLTPGVSRAHIARAIYEGIAFRVREVLDALFALTPPPEAIGVDGGMSASESFLQIQADLAARPIRRHAVGEATALGAALCAGRGAGLLTDADAAAFVRYDRTFLPRISPDEAAARYATWRAKTSGPNASG